MRLNLRIAILLLASVVWTSSSIAAGADFPLAAGPLATGPHSHVRLTNVGAQPITAWSLATVVPMADGRTHREIETVDGYLSEVTAGLPGSLPRLERLMPGESRDMMLDPLAAEATVQVAAVVLDDGTALGDEPAIASIFERRVKERDALGAVVDAFKEVLATAHGGAALDALGERLNRLVRQDPSIPCQAALDAVAAYRSKTSPATPGEIDRSLQTYADLVAREYELARKHSVRTLVQGTR